MEKPAEFLLCKIIRAMSKEAEPYRATFEPETRILIRDEKMAVELAELLRKAGEVQVGLTYGKIREDGKQFGAVMILQDGWQRRALKPLIKIFADLVRESFISDSKQTARDLFRSDLMQTARDLMKRGVSEESTRPLHDLDLTIWASSLKA